MKEKDCNNCPHPDECGSCMEEWRELIELGLSKDEYIKLLELIIISQDDIIESQNSLIQEIKEIVES